MPQLRADILQLKILQLQLWLVQQNKPIKIINVLPGRGVKSWEEVGQEDISKMCGGRGLHLIPWGPLGGVTSQSCPELRVLWFYNLAQRIFGQGLPMLGHLCFSQTIGRMAPISWGQPPKKVENKQSSVLSVKSKPKGCVCRWRGKNGMEKLRGSVEMPAKLLLWGNWKWLEIEPTCPWVMLQAWDGNPDSSGKVSTSVALGKKSEPQSKLDLD